ncbi:hypothetical protein [Croceivirga lutea]|uniref:hypothetical protein n=1 Tax=Croceivirga lutea TaxID=1775167 RepID=UPI00163A756C|nr:hypothetical protein [Croceivirga lutea]
MSKTKTGAVADNLEIKASQTTSLLNTSQIEKLSAITTVSLYDMVNSDYEGIKEAQFKRNLTPEEIQLLIQQLTKATKDENFVVDPYSEYAYRLKLEGTDYFLTLNFYEGMEQIKIGDITRGVVTSNANSDFFEAIKTIVSNE